MALPKEPRQKMINIMYLVLTALLAINISAEILNAFKTINNSLEKTNSAVNLSSTQIFESLTKKMSEDGTRAKAMIWQPRAKTIMDEAAKAYNFIDALKKEIIKEAGGDPNDPNTKFKEDDQDASTRVLVKNGKGKELLAVLTRFKSNVLGINDTIMNAFKNSLQVDLERPKSTTSKKKSWEEDYFYMAPSVGALSILSKFQNDVKTSENKLVTFCHEQVGKVELRFDKFDAIVGQNSKYFMPGQEIEITAGLGAFSTSKVPDVFVGGSKVTIDPAKGVAVHKQSVGGVGAHTINVKVQFIDQDGQPQEREFPVEYVVGQANASIALDKMNVLYVGVDNPVSIAASGGGDDRVAASIAGGGGSLTRIGNGKYIARVNSVTDDCKISVNVDGKLAGQGVFRVRTIPEAQAYVGGKPSGENVAAGAFKAQGGVGAGIKNFPFELEYNVVSFTFTCDTDDDIVSIPVQGAAFSGAVRNAMNQHVIAGRMVTIDDIRVKGPDGRTTKAPSLVYYIK